MSSVRAYVDAPMREAEYAQKAELAASQVTLETQGSNPIAPKTVQEGEVGIGAGRSNPDPARPSGAVGAFDATNALALLSTRSRVLWPMSRRRSISDCGMPAAAAAAAASDCVVGKYDAPVCTADEWDGEIRVTQREIIGLPESVANPLVTGKMKREAKRTVKHPEPGT